MRDLTKRGMSGAMPRPPTGLSFEIADLVLIKSWANRHEFHMLVRLDHGVAVNEEYEEAIALQTKISPLYQFIVWRNKETVFVQPLIGREKRYSSVAAAFKCPSKVTFSFDKAFGPLTG